MTLVVPAVNAMRGRRISKTVGLLSLRIRFFFDRFHPSCSERHHFPGAYFSI
jgi:hypothetical protein